MWSKDSGNAEISFVIISKFPPFVKFYFWIFSGIFGYYIPEVIIWKF